MLDGLSALDGNVRDPNHGWRGRLSAPMTDKAEAVAAHGEGSRVTFLRTLRLPDPFIRRPMIPCQRKRNASAAQRMRSLLRTGNLQGESGICHERLWDCGDGLHYFR